ncbi:hypothetical protein [Nocardia sp. GAS34]|uniref:hypothetical protein n=1 Tax=unclassified Nocardia TaxID=2637762 RepID=UPI003D20BA4D
MTIVILRREDPLAFVADACAALAEENNRIRAVGQDDTRQLVQTYAELVISYAHLARPTLTSARADIIDHLVDRVSQAQTGDIGIPLLDIVDRLHGELTHQPTPPGPQPDR